VRVGARYGARARCRRHRVRVIATRHEKERGTGYSNDDHRGRSLEIHAWSVSARDLPAQDDQPLLRTASKRVTKLANRLTVSAMTTSVLSVSLGLAGSR